MSRAWFFYLSSSGIRPPLSLKKGEVILSLFFVREEEDSDAVIDHNTGYGGGVPWTGGGLFYFILDGEKFESVGKSIRMNGESGIFGKFLDDGVRWINNEDATKDKAFTDEVAVDVGVVEAMSDFFEVGPCLSRIREGFPCDVPG